MVFCTDLNFFFKRLDTFLFFFNCNQTKKKFLTKSKHYFFPNALYKGVSQFSPGTLASSTTKTGCHHIAEILLKVALKHQKSITPSINL
jgi:hypothetical protein